jgi:16S rRNA U516 pseudouridylate synthase RsuA-like enzyme
VAAFASGIELSSTRIKGARVTTRPAVLEIVQGNAARMLQGQNSDLNVVTHSTDTIETVLKTASEVDTTITLETGDTVQVTLHEGLHRQLRRMFHTRENEVLRLCRLSFGPVALHPLAPAHARYLTAVEERALYKVTKLKPSPVERDRTAGEPP